MRFKEFADPKDYIPTVADAEHFVKQLQSIWPDRSENQLAPAILRNRKKAAGHAKETARRYKRMLKSSHSPSRKAGDCYADEGHPVFRLRYCERSLTLVPTRHRADHLD